MKLSERIRILPMLVIVAMLCFTLRLGEVVTGVRQIDAQGFAAEPAKAAGEATGPAAAPADGAKASESTDPKKEAPVAAAPGSNNMWADPASADLEDSGRTDEILNELSNRRKELDAREQTLNQREALLQATEQQINQKIDEMNTLRLGLENLLGKQKEEEDSRINSLVKIYEGMKPKEAARIFDSLDMNILLSVIGRMSERKSAPIIAAMDPMKAKDLTTMLAEQKKLPELPNQPIRLP